MWTAAESNAITTGNLVGGPYGHLRTFGCIQWENELFGGRPKARCYPFNIQDHRFRHKKNPQVDALYRTRYRKHYRVEFSIIVLDIIYNIVYDIGLDIIKLMMLPVQDCVCVVASYPFRIEPLEDYEPIGDLDVTGGGDVWYARPLLFFTCTVCPTGHMGDTTLHKDFSLVFFNTFEPISLTPESCMQRKGVPNSNAVKKGGFSGAIALCLPSGKRPWTGVADSILPERQLSQYKSSLLQG